MYHIRILECSERTYMLRSVRRMPLIHLRYPENPQALMDQAREGDEAVKKMKVLELGVF